MLPKLNKAGDGSHKRVCQITSQSQESTPCSCCQKDNYSPDVLCLRMLCNSSYKMIAWMLHLLIEQNRLCTEPIVSSIKECATVYETENRTISDMLDQIWKDTDLYLYVNMVKSKQYG